MTLTTISYYRLLALSIAPFIFYAPITYAAQTAKQCIVMPQRTSPCPNLLYTSLKKEDVTHVICVCKSDKKVLLKLMLDDTVSSQRILVRKLLNQHQLSKAEMKAVIEDISISY
ncbi:MAG: hypothetical protein HRU25_17435 [Psychrobium sp.]|nr:hypothetical protein [Psychrobium sp.]